VRISHKNQQLLFALALIGALGLLIGYWFEKGLTAVSGRRRVLALAEPLAQCTTREQYLALLEKHFPRRAPLQAAPAMRGSDERTTASGILERLPDGRLKVAVVLKEPQQLLGLGGNLYLPPALVDDNGHGYRLVDLRLNSRKADLVLEYYYAAAPEREGSRVRHFLFFLDQEQLALEPGRPP